ncbi:hypothetical protein GGF37_004437, partial [Kickxella alabastrina]
MSLLQMTPSTAHTASTPDLSSNIMPELFDYEKGRPRSWSVRSEDDLHRQSRQYANHTPPNALIWSGPRRSSTLGQTSPSSPSSPSSPPMPMSAAAFFSEESGAEKPQDHSSRNATNSARAASIRSSARSSMLFGDGFFDNMVSRSQPQVATTFTGGARPIEARGKVVAQAQAQAQAQTQAQSQQPGSSRVRSRSRPVSFYGVPASMSGRKNVLNMLRPLATRDMPSEAPSSTTDNDGTASTLSTSTSTSDSASASASASESESVPAFAAAISTAVAAAPTKPNDAASIVAVGSILASDTAPTKNTSTSSSDECKDSIHTATDTTSSAEQLTPRTSAARHGLVSNLVVEPVSAVITTHDVVVGFDEAQQHQQKHQQKQPDSLPDQSVSIWSNLAWLTLRSSSNAGQKQVDSEPVAHKAAVDRLRDIKSKQPAAPKVDSAPASNPSASIDSAISPDAPNAAEDIATSTGSTVIDVADESLGSSVAAQQGVLSREAVDNSPNAADGNLNAETEARTAVAIATEPEKAASTSTGWFRGWLGTHRDATNSNVAESVSALNGRRSIQLSENNANSEVGPPHTNAVDTLHSLSVAGTGASKSTLLAPKNGQSSPNADVLDSRSHNPHPQGNMLLPDLDIGDKILAASNVAPTASEPPAQSRCSTSSSSNSSSKSSSSSNGDARDTTIYKDGRPLHKRLRTIGKSVFESFVDMAPDWARTIVRGKTGADTLGQSGITSDNGGEQLTSGQIRESMDEGAKSLGRIAVIGVHGWFPIRMVQMIAGEPTGKSEKFCLMMRDALKSYLLESHGVEIDDEEITLFPLVGEGRIEDRVELLLSQITDTDEPADKSHPENAPARSESRAASDIISLSATAAASSKGKRKSIAVTTAAKEAVAADSSSNPTGKQSVVIADAFMPERSMRAEILKAADTVFV